MTGVSEEELARWEAKIDKFHPGSRETILRLIEEVHRLRASQKGGSPNA